MEKLGNVNSIEIPQNIRITIWWRYCSSGRVPALQVQSPKFKPQFHQKNKQTNKKKQQSKKLPYDPAFPLLGIYPK
jgi:hypothetical protein